MCKVRNLICVENDPDLNHDGGVNYEAKVLGHLEQKSTVNTFCSISWLGSFIHGKFKLSRLELSTSV